MLNGGEGADRFEFDAALNAIANVDTISDFTPGEDVILLDQSVFTAFATANVVLAVDAFYSAPGAIAAQESNNRIIYNSTNGNLYYDPDGTAAQAATLFATLTGAPVITAADFFVVA
jgi:Ca2+-binding RTX toxin-like protein